MSHDLQHPFMTLYFRMKYLGTQTLKFLYEIVIEA